MHSHVPGRTRILRTVLLCCLALVGATWLWIDHHNHLASWTPYLLLLACPIVHLLGHRSHGIGSHGRKP